MLWWKADGLEIQSPHLSPPPLAVRKHCIVRGTPMCISPWSSHHYIFDLENRSVPTGSLPLGYIARSAFRCFDRGSGPSARSSKTIICRRVFVSGTDHSTGDSQLIQRQTNGGKLAGPTVHAIERTDSLRRDVARENGRAVGMP